MSEKVYKKDKYLEASLVAFFLASNLLTKILIGAYKRNHSIRPFDYEPPASIFSSFHNCFRSSVKYSTISIIATVCITLLYIFVIASIVFFMEKNPTDSMVMYEMSKFFIIISLVYFVVMIVMVTKEKDATFPIIHSHLRRVLPRIIPPKEPASPGIFIGRTVHPTTANVKSNFIQQGKLQGS